MNVKEIIFLLGFAILRLEFRCKSCRGSSPLAADLSNGTKSKLSGDFLGGAWFEARVAKESEAHTRPKISGISTTNLITESCY